MGSTGAIKVTAPAEPGGEYRFAALVTCSEYKWDLGDHLGVANGQDAAYTYDLDHGELTIVLSCYKEGSTVPDVYATKIILNDDATNQKPSFVLDVTHEWIVIGETVTFSAAGSTDADGDTLRYSWNCNYGGAILRRGIHAHSGQFAGGKEFASPPVGAVTVRKVPGPEPEAQRQVEGDLCTTLGLGAPFGTANSVSGSFTKSGLYEMRLLASDGITAPTSGVLKVWVTKPEDRPPTFVRYPFTDTLIAGTGGLQNVANQVPGFNQTLDQFLYPISMPIHSLEAWVNLTYDGGDQDPQVNVVSWQLHQGEGTPMTGGGENQPNNVYTNATLAQGNYILEVQLNRGANVEFTISFEARMDLDPAKVY